MMIINNNKKLLFIDKKANYKILFTINNILLKKNLPVKALFYKQ